MNRGDIHLYMSYICMYVFVYSHMLNMYILCMHLYKCMYMLYVCVYICI